MPAAAAGPVQELRDAIAAFSAVKPSIAWAETYPGTMSYYLASAFREVWMQPSGTVALVGFATNAMFLRDAFEKAGIEAQFVARGEYKSAANMYTQDKYTEPHREADSRLIESLHGQVLAAIADSRNIDAAELDALVDRAPLLRDDAVTANLVDRIGFRDEAYERLGELAGGPTQADATDALPRLFLGRYAHATAGHGLPEVPSIPGRKAQAHDRGGDPGRRDRQWPRWPVGLSRRDRPAPEATPSPRHYAKPAPTTTCRPWSCGWTAPAVR